MALDLLALGASATQAIGVIAAGGPALVHRQVLVVDRDGGTAIHSGAEVLGRWAAAKAENVACAGNLLAAEAVPDAMLAAFQRSPGVLADRLLAALQAALDAGGEASPVHSAGLTLVDAVSCPVVDLRVDWTEACPIAGLRDL